MSLPLAVMIQGFLFLIPAVVCWIVWYAADAKYEKPAIIIGVLFCVVSFLTLCASLWTAVLL